MKGRAGAALLLVIGTAGCVAPAARIRPPAAPAPLATSAAPTIPFPESEFSFSGRIEQGGWITGRVPRLTRGLSLGDSEVAIAADGSFFAGFDRDAPATLTLMATSSDGRSLSRNLAIAPRQWRIERLNVPLRGDTPSDVFMETRRPELAAIAAARAAGSASEGWRQTFIRPAPGRFSGRFGSQRIFQGVAAAYHSGLDIAGGAGTPFVSPADGLVTLAAHQPFTLEGRLVIVDHGMGLVSAFLHAARLDVREGDLVVQGQTLGTIGATGRTTGPHLHWSLTWEGKRLDPESLLAR